MPVETLIYAFVLPFVGISVWCAIVWMPWSGKRWGGKGSNSDRTVSGETGRLALTVLGAVALFIVSARVLIGAWPTFPPTMTTSVNSWFLYLGVGAGVFSLLDVFLAKPWWARGLVRTLACAGVCGLPVMLLIKSGWYTQTLVFDRTSGPLWIFASSALALLGWYAFTPANRDASRLPTVVPLGVYLGIAAPTMVVWSVAVNAQFLGAVALVLVPIGVVTIWRPSARAVDAVLGYCVLMAYAALTAAYHFADEYPPAGSAILIALAPASLLLMRVPMLAKKGHVVRTILATALVLIVSGAGAGLGAMVYLDEDSGSGGGDDYFEDVYGE